MLFSNCLTAITSHLDILNKDAQLMKLQLPAGTIIKGKCTGSTLATNFIIDGKTDEHEKEKDSTLIKHVFAVY